MDENRPAARAIMACLGDRSRFRLVKALLGGARCVTDLASEVGLSQSCTTRHLQVLARREVVRGRRDGKRVLYRLRDDDPRLMPLLGWAMSAREGMRGQPPGGTGEHGAARASTPPAGARPGPRATRRASGASPGPASGSKAARRGEETRGARGAPGPREPAGSSTPPSDPPREEAHPPRPEWTVLPEGRGRDVEIEDFLL